MGTCQTIFQIFVSVNKVKSFPYESKSRNFWSKCSQQEDNLSQEDSQEQVYPDEAEEKGILSDAAEKEI